MMQSDETAAVTAANDAFYRAFESLDIDDMTEVWARDEVVRCVHPGWGMLQGWTDVMASWERICDNATMMHFVITGAEVSVEGEWAWVACTENLTQVIDGQVVESRVQTTNIFRKRAGRWLLAHHHGSPLMA